MGLVRAVHLSQWAMTHDARVKLGDLLRRLIHASIPPSEIRRVRFLSDESTGLKGWDGLLECDSGVTWVPEGTSVWELGTSAEARDKIRKDFKARLEKDLPAGWIKGETTYVAVTLRNLDDLAELENELKQSSPWRDVKIYDATTMEEWIGRYPSVTTWLQEQRVGPPPSIHTLNKEWQTWSEVTHPSISSKLVLAGREKLALDLKNAINNPGDVINIQGDSPEEAVAFVFATLATDESEFGQSFLDRSIVIRNAADADRLQDLPPQLVILLPPATERAQMLRRCDHIVINALGNSALTQRVDVTLKKPNRDSFAKALMEMGMSKEETEIETRACGASPSVWRVWNLLKSTEYRPDIEWAKPQNADLAVPAILLGGWSDQFEGDKEVITEISGLDFTVYRDRVQHFLSTDTPLLIKIGDAWIVSAPAAFFALVINLITTGHLEKFSRVVHKVFQEIDPIIDLPPDDRPYSSLKTPGMRHSHRLRNGLAQTLLSIVVIGKRLEERNIIPENQNCQSFVDHLIRNLPGLKNNWSLILSLREQLPVLAEAAPFPFLEALEHLLQGTPEEISTIFTESGGVLGGHAFYPHILWALETLAWEPTLLGRVGVILTGLAKADPGGLLGNRPIDSLREIFLAWHPGTSATLEQRLQVLDRIIEREPEIGWTLLMSLMPKSHESSFGTHEPKWKDFNRSHREPLTRGGMRAAYQQYIDRALLHAGSEPDRWKKLIGIYPMVSETDQEAVEKGLQGLAETGLAEGARKELWETIRNLVNRHRGYPDASWALPEEQLNRLESLMELFLPVEEIDRISWLFNEHFPDIPFPMKDLDGAERELNKLRNEAVKKLWQKGGIPFLVALLDKVEFPGLLALPTIALIADENELLMIFQETNKGSNNQRFFAKCLSEQAFKKFGDRWTELILYKADELSWPADAIVNALELYPDSLKTFELVASLGPEVEKYYWEVRNPWIHAEESISFRMAVDKFLWARRALDVLALAYRKPAELGSSKVLEIIDQALEELNKGKIPRWQNITYYIEKLFNWLRGQSDISKVDIAQREYAFLPLLTRYDKKHLALHELLAEDARFFVDIICDLYKPSSAEAEEEQISEECRRRAEFAWELLHSWYRPPGIEENGQVNGQKLREWVETARRLAGEKDRGIIADQHIGKVLYYFPPDSTDNAWPHIELRKLLEDLQSTEIEKGIEIEQYNARGVVTKAIFEGGAQERELATKWKSWAETIGFRWPRTRAMLDRIAASWEAYARHEDERAEKDRHRFL